MSWNGEERRKGVREDTPIAILIEMRADLKNCIANFNKHEKEDHEKFEKLDVRTAKLELQAAKIWGGAAVIMVVIEIVFKSIK